MRKQHVFIVGSKGIPAAYGGFESFVDRLTFYKKSDSIVYHVACSVDKDLNYKEEFIYNNAHCFNIPWRCANSSRAIFYDIDAINYCIDYIKTNKIENPIVYILACRIGVCVKPLVKKIHALGGKMFLNPDGHEWKRAKWSAPVRFYWKLSERNMVKYADYLVCDSKEIERYICEDYKKFSPQTTFIAYGADTEKSFLKDDDKELLEWYQAKSVKPKNYYLIVGRFVPENNYETMLREFMLSSTTKDLVIITNNEGNPYFDFLDEKVHFTKDRRIKFVGTVYNQELLKKIRENAYGYLHGHEVGGTNPSLLEALGSTPLNMLLNVAFNKEVGEGGAVYWDKTNGSLASLIDETDGYSKEKIMNLSACAKQRIKNEYSWEYIVKKYEDLFLAGAIK